MKITLKFLEEKSACSEGIDFFKKHFSGGVEHKELITVLLTHNRYDYAAWTITRLLKTTNCVKFAVYCAELVLPAAAAAASGDASGAADTAVDTAVAAVAAADDAAAAYYAAYAVGPAADAATAAYAAANAAANAAAYDAAAVAAASNKIKQKIVDYGLKLIDEEEK